MTLGDASIWFQDWRIDSGYVPFSSAPFYDAWVDILRQWCAEYSTDAVLDPSDNFLASARTVDALLGAGLPPEKLVASCVLLRDPGT